MNNITSLTNNPISFEDFRQDNGVPFWWASDLVKMIGYTDLKVFKKVWTEQQSMHHLGINHYETSGLR